MTGVSNNKRITLFDRNNTNLWSNRVILMNVAARLGLSSDLEVGAASAIHPNSVLVASPGAVENAGRAAALADQSDFSARAFGAIMAPSVAGLAIEVLDEAVAVAAAATVGITIIIAVAIIRAGYKVGPASTIHPNTAPVKTPSPSRNTWRVAALTDQADAAASIGAAIIEPPVVRSAIYPLAPLRSRVGKTPADKNHRQQSRKYACSVADECSKLNLIQGHKFSFSRHSGISSGGVELENTTGGRVFKQRARP